MLNTFVKEEGILLGNIYAFISNDSINDLDVLGLLSLKSVGTFIKNAIIKGTVANLAGVGSLLNPKSMGNDPFSACNFSSEDTSGCTDEDGCPVSGATKICEYSCISGVGLEIRNRWTETISAACDQQCPSII